MADDLILPEGAGDDFELSQKQKDAIAVGSQALTAISGAAVAYAQGQIQNRIMTAADEFNLKSAEAEAASIRLAGKEQAATMEEQKQRDLAALNNTIAASGLEGASFDEFMKSEAARRAKDIISLSFSSEQKAMARLAAGRIGNQAIQTPSGTSAFFTASSVADKLAALYQKGE